MERYLKGLAVWCWRYAEGGRDYRGLHFTAKPEACDAISRCLTQLRHEGSGSYRTLPLQPLQAADEAKVTGGRRYVDYRRLRLALHESSGRLRQFSCRVEEDGLVRLDLTYGRLAEFEQGLRDVRAGTGDYAIGPRDGEPLGELDRQSERLWFWPCFGHLWSVP